MKATPVAAVTLALLLAAGVAGCGSDEPDLPSVGGGTASESAAVDTVAAAKAFHDCLQDAGLSVDFQNDLDNEPTIISFTDDVSAIYVIPGGYPGYSTGATQDDIDRLLELTQGVDDPEAFLEVDGQDYTEVWQTCHESSGYDEMDVLQSTLASPQVLEIFQNYVDSSNRWSACARENGWTDVKDAVMPAKTDMTEMPMALLPASITEPQLRALLEVCPNFDPEQAEKNVELLREMIGSSERALPEGYVTEPVIGFDYPGFDGKGVNLLTGDTPDIPDNETTQRLYALSAILSEAASDFYGAAGLLGNAASDEPT
jgi:hypothetical protein